MYTTKIKSDSAKNCLPLPFSEVKLNGYRVMVCDFHLLGKIINGLYLVNIHFITY